jgi:hypothetical protein
MEIGQGGYRKMHRYIGDISDWEEHDLPLECERA